MYVIGVDVGGTKTAVLLAEYRQDNGTIEFLERRQEATSGNWKETLKRVADSAAEMLKKYGKTIVGTALNTDLYYYDADLSKDTAIVIGNEGNGMSEEFEKNTDINVKIPMSGSIDSLNAAVAAGILMYQSRRDKR